MTGGQGGEGGLDGLAPQEAEVTALVGLVELPGVGPATLLRCLEGGAARHWRAACAGNAHRSVGLAPLARHLGGGDAEAGSAILAAASAALRPAETVATHRARGHHLIVRGRDGYPVRLVDDPDPPALLFGAGDLAALDRPAVALVGTRNATGAGRQLAADLALDLSDAGVAVVSGLALGIDGAAHRAIADRSASLPGPGAGPPIGVIAAGLDIAYPRRHLDLHRAVAASGLLLTETPLHGRPMPWRFPARNRIIAGLADAVVVVESRSKGGSMLTAGEALARGVAVLAVPGHPTSAAAAGTNDLLFDGATPVRDVGDVLGVIGLGDRAPQRRSSAEPGADLGPGPRAVLRALGTEPRSLEELVLASGRGLDEVATALAELELAGHVARSGSWYEPVRSARAQGRGRS